MTIAEPPVWGIDQLYRPYVDSMNRAFEMLEVFDEATTSEQIWRLFQVAWPTCDTVPYFVADELIELLPRHAPYGVAYLEGKDAEFYAGLPESFIVYRGCRPGVRDGLSWTTDIDVALLFAQGHRGVTIPDGVVYRARVVVLDNGLVLNGVRFSYGSFARRGGAVFPATISLSSAMES